MSETSAAEASDTDPFAPRRTRRAKKSGAGRFIRDIVIIFVIAVLASALIKAFLVRSYYIPSGSMENTLLINDRVLVNELVPDLVHVQHGDVVVFTDPGGWLSAEGSTPAKPQTNPFATAADAALSFVGLSASDSNNHLIKRVIGLPGDHIECCDALGHLLLNGVPLDEPYAIIPPGQDAATVKFDVTVPAGELWVMGDNRYNSADSSKHQDLQSKGFLPIDDVVGQAFVLTWPVNRWGWLGTYPDVFAGATGD
jgi:signal peptidase I